MNTHTIYKTMFITAKLQMGRWRAMSARTKQPRDLLSAVDSHKANGVAVTQMDSTVTADPDGKRAILIPFTHHGIIAANAVDNCPWAKSVSFLCFKPKAPLLGRKTHVASAAPERAWQSSRMLSSTAGSTSSTDSLTILVPSVFDLMRRQSRAPDEVFRNLLSAMFIPA